MKVKLNYIHPNNYGNLMMASVFIEEFSKLYNKDYDLIVDVESEQELQRLVNSLNNKNLNIKMETKEPIKQDSSRLIKLKNMLSQINKESKLYDINIYLGGDCISEYYSKLAFIFDAIRIYLKSKRGKVFLVGQTIGPFTSYRKIIARFCLKDAVIYTRDNTTKKYLSESIKLNNVYEHRDLAFLPIPHEHEKSSILKKFDLIENEYITLVPSGLYKSYTANLEDYINIYDKLIRELLEEEKLKNKKIVLLAHVIHNENSNDKYIIDILKEMFASNERIVTITDLLMPHEARIILGNGIFTITGRMHAAVSTFEMNKPAISLSYSVKYKGVIGHGLDMNELIIEAAGEEKWSGDLDRVIVEKCNYVLNNYNEILDKIQKNVSDTKQKSKNQIIDLVKKI